MHGMGRGWPAVTHNRYDLMLRPVAGDKITYSEELPL